MDASGANTTPCQTGLFLHGSAPDRPTICGQQFPIWSCGVELTRLGGRGANADAEARQIAETAAVNFMVSWYGHREIDR